MRKRGFNMYLTKQKNGNTIYSSYNPMFRKHQEAEVRVFVGRSISQEMCQNVDECMRKMVGDIVSGISGRRK